MAHQTPSDRRSNSRPLTLEGPRRFDGWRRASSWLLITGGAAFILKFVVLFVAYPEPAASLGSLSFESVFMASGVLLTYAGAAGLHLPYVRNRPTWLVVLVTPMVVVAFILVARWFGDGVAALIGPEAHPLVRLEGPIMATGVACAAIGIGLGRGTARTRIDTRSTGSAG